VTAAQIGIHGPCFRLDALNVLSDDPRMLGEATRNQRHLSFKGHNSLLSISLLARELTHQILKGGVSPL
jgi:hypothetical protein